MIIILKWRCATLSTRVLNPCPASSRRFGLPHKAWETSSGPDNHRLALQKANWPELNEVRYLLLTPRAGSWQLWAAREGFLQLRGYLQRVNEAWWCGELPGLMFLSEIGSDWHFKSAWQSSILSAVAAFLQSRKSWFGCRPSNDGSFRMGKRRRKNNKTQQTTWKRLQVKHKKTKPNWIYLKCFCFFPSMP